VKIGIVCPYDLGRPGGVQAQVLGLSKILTSRGDEVSVIGPGLGAQTGGVPEGVHGVDLGATVAVPGNKSKAPISFDPRLSKVMSVVARDLDVLHIHEPFMPAASVSALRAGPPVVATFHADPSRIARRAYRLGRRQFRRVLGPNVKALTAVSQVAASVLPEGAEVEVIPNGVDTSSMRIDAGRDPHLVAFLGRDEPRKGLDVLLEAWDQVISRMPDTRLVVMGAQRKSEGIEFLGQVDDETKVRVLNQAAIYVAPNTGGESFGIVLVEAMAAGAAVVASDLEAFREVGQGAVRYFEVGRSPALADEVVSVLADSRARDTMASRGIERASDFDWEKVADRYQAVYQAALA